jgi:arylsulfatase A-like enzyme
VAENTIVIFTSDNGFSVGQHGILGKGNGTFPLNMYEESVKIPFIIRLPDGGSAGRVEDALVSHYDILPTFCEWFDLPLPESAPPLPGVSFLPLLQGESGPTREEVILFDEYGPVRMIRTPTDKYVHRFPYGPHEYYDLEADPGETTNLLESDSEAVQTRITFLRGRLLRWYEEHVSPTMDGSRLPVTGSGQLASIPEMLEGAAGFGPRLEV